MHTFSGTPHDTFAQTPTPLPRPMPERVIVISLDGTRPDAMRIANMPNVQSLVSRGAVDWAAQTTYPPVTLTAHASMLTGQDTGWEELYHNSTLPGCPTITEQTFLTIAHEAGYRVGMVVGKEKFCAYWQLDDLTYPEYFVDTEDRAYSFAREGDRSVVDRGIELLEAGYEVLFLHFPNPDYFGHSTSWMSDVYIQQLSSTDAQIGRILTTLESLGLTDSTLIIITADHGGHGTTHGADIPEDMTIPWIIAGAGVIPGTLLTDVTVTDTAATVLWALDLPLPENENAVVGVPVNSAFIPER